MTEPTQRELRELYERHERHERHNPPAVARDRAPAEADSTAHSTADSTGDSMAASVLDRIVHRITTHASARSVYGEPVTAGGVTVIPVARVAYGFGGGAGQGWDASHAGEGGGGGGGVDARPLGFIEITETGAVFKPIRNPWTEVVLPVASLVVAAAPTIARAWSRRARTGRPQ